MSAGLFNGVSWKVRTVFFAMTFGAVAVPIFLIVVIGRPKPIAREAVFGCYTAANAPALLIENDAILIVEPAQRRFSYIAEPSKVSYQLHVRPALALSPLPNRRYKFIETQGVGYFWSLLPVDGKNEDRIRHPDEYAGRFELHAVDGTRFVYSRTTASDACRDIR